MYQTQLYCPNAMCGASFEAASPTPDPGSWSCQFCGSDLYELGSWTAPESGIAPGESDADAPSLHVISAPAALSQILRMSPTASEAKLETHFFEAARHGTPTLLSHGRLRAVLLNLEDLKRLLEDRELTVTAHRQRSPDGWVLDLQLLAVSAHGWQFERAFLGLLVKVRERVHAVLGDPMEDYAKRDLALWLWTADCEGRLPQLLEQSVRLG